MLLPVFLFSCTQNNNDNSTINESDTFTAKNEFFPVTSFLKGEMFLLDSLPVTILQLTTVNNKQDSAWLPVSSVKPKLSAFISDEINKKNMLPYFKESQFNDQSTEAITFTYDPKTALPDSFQLRHWDVYVDPDKGTVRRIYMIKRVTENNHKVTKQLTWQTGKWAKITSIINDTALANPVIKEMKWIWDLSAEVTTPSPDKNTPTDK